MKHLSIAALSLAALAIGACDPRPGGGQGRNSVHAAGSSTVYPFARSVSELFSYANPDLPSAKIEAIGSGGGIAQFCRGVGFDTPDMANASRRMKEGEFRTCVENGVDHIVELQVGMDGIALVSSKDGIDLALTPRIVYEALAANPYGRPQTNETWSDIDPALPDAPILVYGPPVTSGTRDALEELIVLEGCKSDPAMAALEDTDEERFEEICTDIRSDGKYVDQGEQDNLIIQKVEGNFNAVGVLGYSYLEENAHRLKGLTIDGVRPTYEAISDFSYPGARPLYVYVKAEHIGIIPGFEEFLQAWVQNWDDGGPLAGIGLVTNRGAMRDNMIAATTELPALQLQDLQK